MKTTLKHQTADKLCTRTTARAYTHVVVGKLVDVEGEIARYVADDERVQGYESWSAEDKARAHKNTLELIESAKLARAGVWAWSGSAANAEKAAADFARRYTRCKFWVEQINNGEAA